MVKRCDHHRCRRSLPLCWMCASRCLRAVSRTFLFVQFGLCGQQLCDRLQIANNLNHVMSSHFLHRVLLSDLACLRTTSLQHNIVAELRFSRVCGWRSHIFVSGWMWWPPKALIDLVRLFLKGTSTRGIMRSEATAGSANSGAHI